MIARPYASSSSRPDAASAARAKAAAVSGKKSQPTGRGKKKEEKKGWGSSITIGGFSPVDDIAWGEVVKASIATTIALSIAYTLFLFAT